MALIGFTGCSSVGVQPPSQPAPTPSVSPLPDATVPHASVGTAVSSATVGPELVTAAPGRVIKPKAGQLDVHPIQAQRMSARRSGPHTVIDVDFVTGAAPCHVLDSVLVTRNGNLFAITLEEGHSQASGSCSEILEAKRTVVDLGALDPGKYTISDAMGGAQTISISVTTID